MASLIVVTFLLADAALQAADPRALILIPTLYNGPGALGSSWHTETFLTAYDLLPLKSAGVTFFIYDCVIPEGCFVPTVNPRTYTRIEAPLPAQGLVLNLPAEQAELLFIAARVRATPRTAAGGTELPIVRESQLHQGPMHLHFVPIVAGGPDPTPYRTTLRVYNPDGLPNVRVRVSVAGGGRDPAVDLALTAFPPLSSDPDSARIPSYAEVNLQSAFPLDGLPNGSFGSEVVVTPLESGGITPRIWAMITVVDNKTQQMTIVGQE
jgi:hypothetical protein